MPLMEGVSSARETGRRMQAAGLVGTRHLAVARQTCSRLGLTPRDSTLVQCLCPSMFSEATASHHRRAAAKHTRRIRSTEVGRRDNTERSCRSHAGRRADPARVDGARKAKLDYQLRWRAVPAKLLADRLRSRLRCALTRAGAGKSASTLGLTGCEWRELRAHIEGQFTSGMSWENRGDWEVDHVVPLAAFDLTDEAQLRAACRFTNLRPMWKRDNRAKGARIEVAVPASLEHATPSLGNRATREENAIRIKALYH
jgi:hypothetical protein